ncbi:MFS transporter [Desulfoluna spongiiphila]|uniref:MFS transporter, YNFM family, putative membrane transport protein n=1 Tax=Desulfoluna spongiiphila TaxID=419481 RepID=A0A1G5BIJ3_9BACT|nr:MFS transporter [Desulfoluna spongiiphila]SCX89936.1 MFS transporter, YNFM family, putative membrane transport protein [Desulfoluna spongiiphila]
MPEAPQSPPSLRAKAATTCLMVMTAVATVFMTQSIFLEISTAFQLDIARARFAFSVASLCYAAAFFFIGPLADRFDLPKMALTGLTALWAAILLASVAPSFSYFITAMGLIGFSAALVPASMIPHMTLLAPPKKLGLYVGAVVASGTLGIVFGRVAVGLLTAHLGWRVAFRIVAVLLMVLWAAAYAWLMETTPRRQPAPRKLSELYLGAIRLVCTPKPLALFATGFFLFFGFLGMVTFLTYRLTAPPFFFTAGEVGWISLAGLTALIAPFAGSISQQTGPYKVSLPGLGICLVALQLMGWSESVPLITLGLLLLFAGAYCCQPLIFLLIGASVPKTALGSASSLYILVCIGGGSLSSMVLGPVWALWGWPGITLACSLSLAMAAGVLGTLAMREAQGNQNALCR